MILMFHIYSNCLSSKGSLCQRREPDDLQTSNAEQPLICQLVLEVHNVQILHGAQYLCGKILNTFNI